AAGADTFGDVFARAGGTVDRADDRDVVSSPVTAVTSVVAHPPAGFRFCRRLRTVLAEGVVTVESTGADVVDVDVTARGNVLARETEDRPALADGFAFGVPSPSALVPPTHAVAAGWGMSVDPHRHARCERAGGDGDVVFGTQVDGGRRGWHGMQTPRHVGEPAVIISHRLGRRYATAGPGDAAAAAPCRGGASFSP